MQRMRPGRCAQAQLAIVPSGSAGLLCAACLQPLPSGLVKPDGVLLLSATIYNAVLIAACFMVGGFHWVHCCHSHERPGCEG